MKVSDELKYQLDQFSRMRSCHLDEQLKRELAIWYSENNFGTLNTNVQLVFVLQWIG
jgi:hypothetical protein